MTAPSRRDLIRWLGAAGALLAVGVPADVWAKAKPKTTVTWTSVELPEDKRRAQRERTLRSVLRKEARDEDWGAATDNRIEASVRVIEFHVIHKPDVVRVTCTAMGKLAGGPSVRTHFSIGDHPTKQGKLEHMVLTLVARGLVTRLSAIARNRAARAAKSKAT